MYRLSVRFMIAETFFLTEDSHRISALSLREKLSIHEHELGRCPKNSEIAVIVWTALPWTAGNGVASGKGPSWRHLGCLPD
jgi:hypothetical protein